MNVWKALEEAKQRAKREKYEMHVSYYPDHPALDSDNRCITHRADTPYPRSKLMLIVTPKGTVHAAHHHLRQDGEGGTAWTGLRRECPFCNPKKRGKKCQSRK